MAQIMMPKKSESKMGSYLQAGGAIGGAIVGTMAAPGAGTAAGATTGATLGGALTGAATGSALGGTLGGLASRGPEGGGIPQGGSELAAMTRRHQQLGQDNLATLSQAEKHLTSLPEGLRQQYAAPIIQARMLEQRQRGLA